MFRTRAIALATLATTALALTACGSDSLSEGSSSTTPASSSSSTPSVDPALVAKLPEKVKSAGKIVIGTDATYQPNEYLDADGKTVIGMDVELFDAVMAKFGVKTEWVPSAFDAIILGVQSSKYDVGVSSFTVNTERMQQATMVSYFKAGTQWVTQKGNPKAIDPEDACGKNVAVQKGTVQADVDLPARQKACTDAGKPEINVLVDADQAKVTASVQSGKADAMLVDLPPAIAAVDSTGGSLELLGEQYDSAPYGYVLKKDDTAFGEAIVEALKQLEADGTYKDILTKWKTEGGAISDFAVNPTVSCSVVTSSTQDRPGAIDARPVRHPGRWVAVVVIAIVVAMIISSFVTNEKWNFPFAFEIMQQTPVIEGLWKGTIFGTVGAMVLGIGLGIVLAVMRLSTNPVLRGVAFVYTWFFRAIPRYVLLVLLGTGIGFLYPAFDIGVPFGQQIADALGIDTSMTFFSLDYNSISSTIWVGILGLGLSEAAYMAEIARAGILSVDKGQAEAAQALGMPPGKTMRRVVLPQAMRVIVPPTGNETIAMVKDTSLLAAVPVIVELFYQSYQFGQRSFQIMPGIVAATIWYLVVCSILMVGQSRLERYYGRGFGAVPKKTQQNFTEIKADH